jgi:hypothetical protein
LIRQFAFLKERRAVFENHLMEIGPEPGPVGKEIVIGWAGSLGHTEDIQWIAPVIGEVCSRHPHVRFAFMGNRNQYDHVFGDVENERFSFNPSGSLDAYYRFLEGLDIGLAPLLETHFNVCRSDVKFVEYASRGVLPAVSDTGPYQRHVRHGKNGLLFKSPANLLEMLDALVTDPVRIQRIRNNAYAYIQSHRMEKNHAGERMSFYKGLSEKRSTLPLPSLKMKKVRGRENVLCPIRTSAEKMVLRGVEAASRGQKGEALDLWTRAGTVIPGYTLPFMCAGGAIMGEDPGRAVEFMKRAVQWDEKAVKARFLLGKAMMNQDHASAREIFKILLDRCPSFAPAWHALGKLARDEGRISEACSLMNRALEVNPFLSTAAYDLGHLYRETGESNLAVDAFKVATDLFPDNEPYQCALVESLFEAERSTEALQAGTSFLQSHPESRNMAQILTLQIRQAASGD